MALMNRPEPNRQYIRWQPSPGQPPWQTYLTGIGYQNPPQFDLDLD